VTQVNLLPREILQGQRTRRVTLLVAAGGVVLVALIFLFYLIQVSTLGGVEKDIRTQEDTNASYQAEIADLQKYEDLQVQAQAKQALLDAAFANEASFSGLLMDVSRVIPVDAYLASLSIQLNAPGTADEQAVANGFVGTMQASGSGVGVEALSQWLTHLEQVKGWVNPWMGSVARDADSQVYTFSSSVDLTRLVLTKRGARGVAAVAG
jgi:Tfp pilus assembly protein PilN